MPQTAVEPRRFHLPIWAPLVIRLALGTVFMAHGAQKIFGVWGGGGMEGVIGMVTEMGFRPPLLWAWLLGLTEFGGGILVIVGLFTRLAALGLLTVALTATAKVHWENGFFLQNGGFEFLFVLGAMAISLIISGAGWLSLDWLLRRAWTGRRAAARVSSEPHPTPS